MLAHLGNPEQRDVSETLNKPKQLENAERKNETLETLKTQHKYNNQRTPNPSLRPRDALRIFWTSGFRIRSNLAARPGPAAARPSRARPSGRLTSVQPLPGDRILMLESYAISQQENRFK